MRAVICISLTLSIAISLIGCGSGGVIPGDGNIQGDITLLIANSLGETLSIATRANGVWSMQRDVLPTGQSPNDIIVEGKTAYVINSLSNSVQVVDTETMTTIREISTGPGTNPFSAALDDDGTLWVSLTLANRLIHIDPDAAEPILHTVDLPGPDKFDDDDPSDENLPWPETVCYLGGKVYVAFSNLNSAYVAGGAGGVGIIDGASGEVDRLMNVQGRNTVSVSCPDPSTELIYIISAGDFSLSTFSYIGNGLVEVFDHDSGTMLGSLEMYGAPFEVALGPAGAGYVADAMNGEVLRFDYNNLVAWPAIDIPDSGLGFKFISGIECFDSNNLAVLEFNSDNLYIVDGVSGEIKESLIAGDGPDAVAVLG